MNWLKKNPVLALSIIATALAFAESQAEAQHLISGRTLAWAVFGTGIVNFVVGLIVHNVVTPVAAPRDNAGNVLVPSGSEAAVNNAP